MTFTDRSDAGRQLAAVLRERLGGEADVVVVGLPRGGVPVAYEVAQALGAPLDVIVVRKLGVPTSPELAMGAVGEQNARVLDDRIVARAAVSADELARVEQRELAEVDRRAALWRGLRPAVPLHGRTVVVVDDGIATGATARAALRIARARGAARTVLAVPVGPPDTPTSLAPDADEVICLSMPAGFFAVGSAYDDFAPTTDDEVSALLRNPSFRRS